MTKEILESDVCQEKDAIEDSSIVYPDYDLNPFHAYDEGNLSWLTATMLMVRRAIPYASSLDVANQIVCGNWLQATENHQKKYSIIGDHSYRHSRCWMLCWCEHKISCKQIPLGQSYNLSPYFVAVAQYKEKTKIQREQPISWIHGNGENAGLPSKSFDLVSIAIVFHECPYQEYGTGSIPSS